LTGDASSPGDTVLRIVHVYPTVLGLYGDRGNALVLASRAERRGIASEVVSVQPGEPVPAHGDIYLLGGGEDLAQTTAADLLRADGTLARVVGENRVVFAVCAGMQIVGHSFNAASGNVPGLGLVDITTTAGVTRAVGELVVEPLGLDVPVLTGYENHRGRTSIGPDAKPLGRVTYGIGNGDGHEGVVHGRLVGTYLHGPALARNPLLADVLLGWATGDALAPLDDPIVDALRTERLRAVRDDPKASTPEPSTRSMVSRVRTWRASLRAT
jgi:lipid II isoglutaminyl synthase (glutamine-hydrolysing)